MLCTHKTASSASLVLEICPQFNNSYLNQFSSISGGNCIKYYGVNVTGIVTKCSSCSLEKIRQKNIPQKNESTAKNPGERMYFDISSMKDESLGGRMWMRPTRCKHSFFLQKKSEQVDMVSSWLKGLKDKYKIQVKFI